MGKRKISIFFLSIFIVSIFIPFLLLSVPAKAATTEGEYNQIAKSWQAYSFIKQSCTLPIKPSIDDARDFKIFEKDRGGRNSTSTEPAGYFISDDGETGCYNNGLEEMLKTDWGFGNQDPEVFLESLGYEYTSKGGLGCIADRFGFGCADGYQLTVSQDEAKRRLLQKIIGNNEDLFPNGASASSALHYYIWSKTFLDHCAPGSFNPDEDKRAKEKAEKNEDDYTRTKLVIGDRWEEVYFKVDEGLGSARPVGHDIGADSGAEATCLEISKKLYNNKGWADAYMTAVASGNAPTPANSIKDLNTKDGDAADDGADCTDTGGVFGWVLCPVISVLTQFTLFADGILYSLLAIDLNSWEENNVKLVWRIFLNLALSVLALLALVAIAGQIFSFQIFSEYTIKKVMPKLALVVILLPLSWFLVTTAIQISNTVGYSVQALMSAPFEKVINENIEAPETDRGTVDKATGGDGWISFSDPLAIYAKNTNVATELIITGAVGAGAYYGGRYIMGVVTQEFGTIKEASSNKDVTTRGAALSYFGMIIIPVVIAIFFGLVTILARSVLLLAALIMAPLALVMWVLPATSKWFEFWYKNLFALLVFFPMVIAILTMGKIGAVIIALSSDDTAKGTFLQLILFFGIFIVYFLPYLFIFKILKLSGGALGKVQGAIDTAKTKTKEFKPVENWRQAKKDSFSHYRDKRARQIDEEDASNREWDGTSPRRVGAGGRWRARNRYRQAQRNLEVGSYEGEIQERKIDEKLDEAVQESHKAVVRQKRQIDPRYTQEYLEKLRDADYDADGNATIDINGEEFNVDTSMMASAIPDMEEMKIDVRKIYDDSRTSVGFQRAVVDRVFADNAKPTDGLYPEIIRDGETIDRGEDMAMYTGTTASGRVLGLNQTKTVREKVARKIGSGEPPERVDQLRTALKFLVASGNKEEAEEAVMLMNTHIARDGNGVDDKGFAKIADEVFGNVQELDPRRVKDSANLSYRVDENNAVRVWNSQRNEGGGGWE